MIETKDLTKKYGDLFAIRAIDMNLAEGDVFGFIGPNGAGKTTTMRIIATLLEPSWGTAKVCGHSVEREPREVRRLVGYMPDFFGVYDDMTVIEYLEFFAAAYRIRGDKRRQVCDEKLQIVDLDFKRDAFANTLSRGQTQRLGLARVLLHDPQVLLLDEPLSGLDPRARIEMRSVLRRLAKQEKKTIVISSHILPELADLCNKVGIIDKGVMDVNASVADVMRQVRERIVLHVQVSGDPEQVPRALKDRPEVESVEVKTLPGSTVPTAVVSLKTGVEDYTDLPAALVSAGCKIKLFREEEINLESAFMALTKGVGKKH